MFAAFLFDIHPLYLALYVHAGEGLSDNRCRAHCCMPMMQGVFPSQDTTLLYAR
jgi:hypothetical protein